MKRGRPELTEDEILTFKDEIADCALKLFARDGYQNVSLRSIAKAAGCSSMTPYRYFRDKADIFDTVRTNAFIEFAKRQEHVAESNAPLLVQLVALGDAYLDFATENPEAYRLMFDMAQPQAASSNLALAEKRAFETLLSTVTEATDSGELQGDARTNAHLLWTGLHGIAALDLTGRLIYGRTRQDLVQPFYTALIHGLK